MTLSLLFSIVLVAISMPVWGKNASSLRFGLSQARYQSSSYTQMDSELDLHRMGDTFSYKFNPLVQGALEAKNELYLGIPEAYVAQRSLGPGFNISVGRSLRHWSLLDEEFNVGIWQPQLRWDYLAPRQEGLTGIFFEWHLADGVELMLFTSPIAIPDQGPQFKLKNGEFESGNPWFYQPQSRVKLFQNTNASDFARIHYEIDKPKNEDLLLQSSFGAAVRLRPQDPFWLQLAYAYKPMNQLHLGLECTSCVDINSMDVNAVIHPMIVKHNVFTLEGGFNQVDYRGYLSVTADLPSSSGMPKEWEESNLQSMLFAGAGFEHFVSGLVVPTFFRYSYMKAYEMKKDKKEGLLGDQVESSLDRYPFREVAAFESRFRLKQTKSQNINLRGRYLYSMPEQGGWLNTSLEWGLGDFTWNLGFDILGSDVDPKSSDAGMLTRYQANDRVTGGLTYVF